MKLRDIFPYIFLVLIIGFFVLIVVTVITITIDDVKVDNFCERAFPSPIKEISTFPNQWGDIKNVESGYVRCCHNYWEEHEKKERCQILPYKK